MKDTKTPWNFLDGYRGKEFEGKWPSLAQLFHITVLRNPERLCWSQYVKNDEVSLTYREAETKIKEFASYLKEMGVNSNSHVAVSGKNSVYWAIAFFSVCYCNAVVVPMDNAYSPEELNNLLKFGDINVLIGDTDRINSVEIPEIKKINIKDVMTLKGDAEINIKDCDCNSVAAILFTSGTTGNPKGVMLTHENLISCCFYAQANMNIFKEDVFYAVLPIHHAYSLQAVFIEAVSVGSHLVFGQKLVFSKILSDMKRANVTMFLAVPLIFNKLIQSLMDGIKKKGALVYLLVRSLMVIMGFFRDVLHINLAKKVFGNLLDKIALKDIRICISGGGPLPESTIKQFHQLGVDFVQGYGMTETSPITHLDPIYAFNAKSVGLPTAFTEQKIVDPDSDGNGEVFIRGSIVMKGYYKNPKATSEIIDNEGWIKTGDIGHIDSKGYLYLTGRAKNIIVSDGGKNIFPEEIEEMFQLYDELEQVCIIPYEKEKGTKSEGIRLLALPSSEVRGNATEDEVLNCVNGIVEEVNRKLQPYKRITKLTLLDSALETTSSKKIKRAEVMKKYYS